jgi:hypothetical protein
MNLRTRLKQLETNTNNGIDTVTAVRWLIIDRLPDDPVEILWTVTPYGVVSSEVYDTD